ncbi:DUF4089 domain-containing protein [Variovorax sp. J22R133]|uniref:DUF4089 domain-containing protein n=1 Tax=Variovorax brevis TaxID=3053503 RepID=UPI002577D710|nr:DUF4089 domain-containing protein [Variovorax sp. J22R133]MDM0111477.1 DUF4089 domain-containing protein [Variovorax sp. J22R133]
MSPEQLEAFVDASANALDLRLRPEHRAGVLRYFALAADMAALVDAVPLDAHVEPAMTFTPVSPRRVQA